MDEFLELINNYPRKALDAVITRNLGECTRSSIRLRLANFSTKLESASCPIWLSIGENCAAAVKLKAAGLQTLGSNMFDNLVAPLEAVIALLDGRFSDVLRLKNLDVQRWENQDSVLDTLYGVFYHHYFYLRNPELEKKDISAAVVRRKIDEADIPLFLPLVQAQFDYLVEKFHMIAKSDVSKVFVQRSVSGKPMSEKEAARLCNALVKFGAKRFRIINVHSCSNQEETRSLNVITQTLYIADQLTRWGAIKDWEQLGSAL